MKIFTLAPSENWICDRFAEEWKSEYSKYDVSNPYEANVIWLLADWCWNQVDPRLLSSKKVVASVHHITPDKFDEKEKENFRIRDQFVNAYHVPCKKTHDQIRPFTNKKIYTFPFWVNQKIWTNKRDQKTALRKKYGLPENSFLIGSFQRDTEGHDLMSPKLEKGPDLFCDAVEKFQKEKGNVVVVLGGWRRQYVISRLESANIPYKYFKLPPIETVNDLYNCLDLYLVSARYEGGPQAIVECASNFTPIISTDVGLSPEILPDESIFIAGQELQAVANPEKAYKNVFPFLMPQGLASFEKLFEEVLAC